MQNSLNSKSSLASLIEGSNGIMIILTFISICLAGIVQFDSLEISVYKNFGERTQFSWAFLHAAFIAMLRMGLMLKSIHDFKCGRFLAGVFGLIGSFVLTFYCSDEIPLIAHLKANGNAATYDAMILPLQILVWSGFALELRVCVSELSEVNNELSANIELNEKIASQESYFKNAQKTIVDNANTKFMELQAANAKLQDDLKSGVDFVKSAQSERDAALIQIKSLREKLNSTPLSNVNGYAGKS